MLGFDVSVYYFDSHGKQQNIARWPANNLHWINDLVRQNRAALVLDGGGYPYAYEVLADEILSMFAVPEREGLDRRIARKAGSGDWNQAPMPRGRTINEEGLARCPENATLTVEAWDQS
ncbi:hypothetical protein [Arthrobacter bambusae]|uniref:hypothetical protein n=1 Tax=Arthrobacter bambusae TaxID=1338426 RepID=UPI002783F166|nr:hypothetical protein [Arthrobacter bambusae]MDQ0241459.1 hypothetical protein [Arthrobacter bambusae]